MVCQLDAEGRGVLKMAINELGISARAYDRILRVPRIIADLEHSRDIKANHISEATQYRTLRRSLWLSASSHGHPLDATSTPYDSSAWRLPYTKSYKPSLIEAKRGRNGAKTWTG